VISSDEFLALLPSLPIGRVANGAPTSSLTDMRGPSPAVHQHDTYHHLLILTLLYLTIPSSRTPTYPTPTTT